MLEALCRQSSTTLDIMHAEDGPPITQRTSGLGRYRAVSGVSSVLAVVFARRRSAAYGDGRPNMLHAHIWITTVQSVRGPNAPQTGSRP